MDRFELVPVAHESNLQLLALQCVTLSRFYSGFRLTVVINDLVTDRLIENVNQHARKCLDINSTAVWYSNTASSWNTQQVTKLFISKHIRSEYYIVLDTKNWLVNYPTADSFLINNKVKLVVQSHINRYAYERSSLYWNTSFWTDQPFAPSLSTPFIFVTRHVRTLIDDVEQKEKKPFRTVYHDLVKTGNYEFAFSSTYFAHKGYLSEYQVAPHYYYTMWNNDYRDDTVNMSEIVFYAIHRTVSTCDESRFSGIVRHEPNFGKLIRHILHRNHCEP